MAYGSTPIGDDGDDEDDIPDHMIAGAYLRKMMVVQAPEYGTVRQKDEVVSIPTLFGYCMFV